MTHDLKILPEYFDAVLSGDKTFEVRSIKDRTFNLGDTLRLREWHYSAEIAGANGDILGVRLQLR
jgi:ASC-1-like (ASCH) protein